MRCPMIARGTSSPSAIVPADSTGSTSSSPRSNDRTSGAQASDCTATILGRRWLVRSTRPSSQSSEMAFQMPTSPVPPPVGSLARARSPETS